MRRCSYCRSEKPVAEFHKNKAQPDGLSNVCKPCGNEYTRNWRKNNPEKQRDYYLKNKTRITEQHNKRRRPYLLSRYGITMPQFTKMLLVQKRACAICTVPFANNKSTHIDHDHATNVVRGLLCPKCNLLLGYAGDNVDVLKAAIAYLESRSAARSA